MEGHAGSIEARLVRIAADPHTLSLEAAGELAHPSNERFCIK